MTYTDRPQRVRSHQLETASRKAFEAVMPDEWVVRPKEHDYGIDLEVELFEHGSATGEVFLVQLKGTDDPDEAHRVPLTLATLGYMEDLRQPVLIVRYLGTTGAMVSRWAHTIDVRPGQEQQKEITVRFDVGQPLDEGAAPELVAAVRAYRHAFLGARPFPLELELHVPEAFLEDERAGNLQRRIDACIGTANRLFSIRLAFHRERRASRSALVVSAAGIDVIVAGRRVKTLPCTSPATAEDVLTALAVAFVDAGAGAEVAALLESVLDRSQASIQSDAPLALVGALIASGRRVDALAYIERFAAEASASPSSDTTVAIATTLVIGAERSDVEFVQDHIVPCLDRLASALEERGRPECAAVFVYNTGNLLQGDRRRTYREAVSRYRRAARLDPDYLTRSYWWSELGGLLFESRRFLASAGCYSRSVALGAPRRVLAQQGDARLHAGDYRGALDAFEAYFAAPPESAVDGSAPASESTWCLKSWCLAEIVDVLGVERGPPGGSPDTYTGDPNDVDALLAYLCDRGILHPRIWFNYGGTANIAGDSHGALIGFLTAAIIEPADKEAFGNALSLALATTDDPLKMHLVDEVLFRHGTEFIDYFRAHHMPPADSDESRECLRTLRAALFERHGEHADRKQTMEVRLNGSTSPPSPERQTDPHSAA